ncbi:MAG: acyl-CoA thioesterase [Chloroflexota bacterium]|nr:acyl-CoA thioesterase [Chloroflexota bacterium]
MTSFTREFKVRHYECDAYGHVNNANYLRYMEQAAIEASAAVGYDDARYTALGTMWLIRETDIEYLLPLKMDDVVAVKTWVADFRRVRSQRRYEFTRVGDGALVARATTDWVYMDRATQRPVSVTPEMIAAYCPDGTPEPTPRERIAAAPPPPPRPHTMQRRVEWRDIDMAQHVNNATYLNYMEECGIQSLDGFGWSVDRLAAVGIAIVARRHQIEYQQPALLGDMLRVTTFLADVRRATAVRHFTIVREKDNVLLARARSQWVFMNPTSLQPARVPEAVMNDFAEHIAKGI